MQNVRASTLFFSFRFQKARQIETGIDNFRRVPSIEDGQHDLCNQSEEQEEAEKGMPHRFEKRKGFETQVQWEGSLGRGISIEGILDDRDNK